jgi:beta-lactamase regulating signal transducer with metallopeptidase domain
MRRTIRLLLVGVFALLVLLPAEPATAAPAGTGTVVVVGQPTSNPPPGTTTNTQQPVNRAKQDLVLWVMVAILLAIVFFGHRSRNKRRKQA